MELKQIIIRESDGYVNATLLCKSGGKEFKAWHRTDKTKEFLEELSKIENISLPLMKIKQGGISENQGTWVHPLVATNIAQWISVKFSIKVSLWIDEWKQHNTENKQKYETAILELEPSQNKDSREKEIKNHLQKSLGGDIEVETPYGYIDLLTEDRLIEVKVFNNWKHALGQVLSYGKFYPERQKTIYLFDYVPEEDYKLLKDIKEFCGTMDVDVMIKEN